MSVYQDITLPSGRVISAVYGVLGIDAGLTVFSGFDETMSDSVELTPQERRELADYMVALWHRFGEQK